jgi:predicted RNA-binding Zn-ribbon protein involved in translation (DUF1610 family)
VAFTKYATVEEIIEVKSSKDRLLQNGLEKFAALKSGIHEEDGYLYVRCRAISSRVNKNNDGWPSEELMKAADTFVGRPIFVDHNNDDPRRTRGVIVEASVHVEDDEKVSAFDDYYASAPDNHKPPTWIELLMEVDAKTYPKLAKAIKNGDIDAVSMGANIDLSVCSVCANEATSPSEYCNHIKQKGITFEIEGSNGERIRKKAYEDCFGIVFFEESFVFDPADPTADAWLDKKAKIALEGTCPKCGNENLDVLTTNRTSGMPSKVGCDSCGWKGSYDSVRKSSRLERTANLHTVASIEEREGKFCLVASSGQELSCYTEKVDAEKRLREYEQYKREGAGIYNYEEDEGLELEDPPELRYDPDDAPQQGAEAQQVYQWRFENLVRAGADPESAAEIAAHPRIDLHQAVSILEAGQPGQMVLSILAKRAVMAKTASPAEAFIEPVDGDGSRERNHEPQADKTTAPEQVDTLRNEQLCPVCRAANMEADPDGIVRCPTCGHVQEPEPVDNPDLSRAKDIDRRLDISETTTPEGDVMVPGQAPSQNDDLNRITFEPLAASNSASTNEGISEMFNVKLRTESKEEADKVLPVKTATAERKLGQAITPKLYAEAAEQKLRVRLSYPAVDDKPNSVLIPGRNGIVNMFLASESSQRLNVPVSEVPIVIEAQDEETLEKFIALLDVEAASEKKPVLPATEKPKDEPSKETVVDDQVAPVEASVKLADGLTLTDDSGATFTLNRTDDGGWAVAPKAEAEEAEEEEEAKPAEAEEAEAEEAEEAAEPAGEAAEDSEPKESAEEAPAEEDEEAREAKIFAAFELADLAVEMGIVDSREKMAHVAALEELTLDALKARKEALEAVKSAGLTSSAPKKVAGVRRVPRLSGTPVIASSNGSGDRSGESDPFGDADLFL